MVWLLGKDVIGHDGTLGRDAPPISPEVAIPGLAPGRYRVTAWDTLAGIEHGSQDVDCTGEALVVRTVPFATDLALAVRPAYFRKTLWRRPPHVGQPRFGSPI